MEWPFGPKEGFSGDSSQAFSLNARREGETVGPVVENLRQVLPTNPDPLGELLSGHGQVEWVPSRHPLSVVYYTTLSSTPPVDAEIIPADHSGMTAWAHQKRFLELCKLHKKKLGIGNERLAELLGLTPSGLHGAMYDRRFKPGLPLIQRACQAFSVPLSELTDDPGAGHDLLKGLGAMERAQFDDLVRAWADEGLSVEDRGMLYSEMMLAISKHLRLKSAVSKKR